MKKYIAVFICLAAGIGASSYIRAEQKGELPEAVIKGDEVLKLDSTKPKLEIPIEQNSEILKDLEIEREIFTNQPAGSEKQPKDFMPELANSPQVIVPRTLYIHTDTICVFYPLSDLKSVFKEPNPKNAKKSATWELIVTDDLGQTFREYSGRGLPPETITFDGRDKDGNIIEVGYSYSTILKYYDTKGALHTRVGTPFIITGLAHQEQKGLYITLDYKKIYKNNPTVLLHGEFSDAGMDLIQEAADKIKKDYFTLPVEVIVYSKDKEIAKIAAKEISERLVKILIRREEEVRPRGEFTTKSLERVDIVVLNQ
ncbi:MAG: hypothetical protein LHV68_06090 [Elusimicrobia bacterium]|nr:hypothetical protein [Candidatus Liberimonas magnetica]